MNENKQDTPTENVGAGEPNEKADGMAQDMSVTGHTPVSEVMAAVKADIEARIGDVDWAAADMPAEFPERLIWQEAMNEVHAGTGDRWGTEDDHYFRFTSGGPVYELSRTEPFFVKMNDEVRVQTALTLLAEFEPQGEEDDEAEDLIEEEFAAEQSGDEGFEDDHDQEAYSGEPGYLFALDEIILPRIIHEEDLAAAGLAGGPGFTHAEALLAALAAANSVAPDMPMDEDMAEALYEFGEKQKWDFIGPETLYRQAMDLMEETPGNFNSIETDQRHWFLVFGTVGAVMAREANLARSDYMGQLLKLKHEIERTRSQQKLADRKAEKLKRRAQRPVLLKRAAERWRKNQKAQERKAARKRRRP